MRKRPLVHEDPPAVREWDFCVFRSDFGYTVELIQAQPDGSEKRARIPLMDLSWSDAKAVGDAITNTLREKTVWLQTDECRKAEIRDRENAIARYRKDIEREEAIIRKLRGTNG